MACVWGCLIVGFIALFIRSLRAPTPQSHQAKLSHLQAFASRLRHVSLAGIGFYQEGSACIRGSYDGRQVQLNCSNLPSRVSFQLRAKHEVGSFALSRAGEGWLGRLREHLLAPEIAGDGTRRFELRDGCERARGVLFQRQELFAAIERLFGEFGLREFSLNGDLLRASKTPCAVDDLHPDTLTRVFDTLGRIAAICERREVQVTLLGPGRHFAWTAGGAALRCPYCHDQLRLEEPAQLVACADCGTLHHEGCFEEAAACTVLGCASSTARPGRQRLGPAKG